MRFCVSVCCCCCWLPSVVVQDVVAPSSSLVPSTFRACSSEPNLTELLPSRGAAMVMPPANIGVRHFGVRFEECKRSAPRVSAYRRVLLLHRASNYNRLLTYDSVAVLGCDQEAAHLHIVISQPGGVVAPCLTTARAGAAPCGCVIFQTPAAR
uniref:Putative secreted protein n=1 Tax=Anopheles triannulatus TaxID=58253 RepID=A0A2M4B4C6_9DIPT